VDFVEFAHENVPKKNQQVKRPAAIVIKRRLALAFLLQHEHIHMADYKLN
jgi:hypothetical protein